MNTVQLDSLSIRAATFVTTSTREADVLTIHFAGEANMDAVAALGGLLDATHARARANGTRQVVLDFRDLEFMNSACFKKLVTWIGKAQALDATERYGIHFLSNPRTHWQRRSLHALRCFAMDLVTIQA